MNFSAQEISRLALFRDGAVEARRLELEIALVKDKSPGVFKAAIEARAKVDAFPPSVLLALGAEVLAAREELIRADFLRDTVASSLAGIESRLAKLNGELKLGVRDFLPVLRTKLKASFPPPTRKDRIVEKIGYRISPRDITVDQLSMIRGVNAATTVEALLAVCRKHGAEIPEATAS